MDTCQREAADPSVVVYRDRYITDPGNIRLPYHPEAFHANRMRRRGYPIRQRWAPVYRTGKHRKRTMR